jgi:hypothetical protein
MNGAFDEIYTTKDVTDLLRIATFCEENSDEMNFGQAGTKKRHIYSK